MSLFGEVIPAQAQRQVRRRINPGRLAAHVAWSTPRPYRILDIGRVVGCRLDGNQACTTRRRAAVSPRRKLLKAILDPRMRTNRRVNSLLEGLKPGGRIECILLHRGRTVEGYEHLDLRLKNVKETLIRPAGPEPVTRTRLVYGGV